MVTDAKTLLDKLYAPALVVKGGEERSSIEGFANTTGGISWVSGGAMVYSNSLTKPSEDYQTQLYVQMGLRRKMVCDRR